MVNQMPKPYRYTIIHTVDEELLLTTDPKGWQEHSIGFTRSDDFGLNVETVIALSFAKEGRDLLRSLYASTGIFTKAYLLIEKRNNDWEFDSFYKYRLDFSTYTDSIRFIEISGIEEGLLSAFSAYKDTEYEITLPITNTIDFTGISVDRKNLIQALFGKMYEKSDLGDDVYPLGGNRSVRTYSDSLAFVDINSEPYETMTIRCIKDITFPLHVKLNNKIVAKRFLSAQGTGGDIKLIKHDSKFGTPQPTIDLTYTKETTVDSGVFYHTNTTTFVGDEVIENISLTAGQCISLCYIAESGSYAEISNSESQDTYMEVTTLVASQYQESTLPVFTFQTLITALLAKIDANATLTYSITNANYDILLTTTNHVKVMGAQSGNVTFKAKLSDALKALNCLENIGIDISGSVMKIDYKSNFYVNTNAGTIVCNNIVLKHDSKHQYNKISVGYKVDERGDNEDLTYPFNCQKEFEIKEALTESAIDLVNPYIADPYEIEQTIIDTAGKVTSELDTKFMILVGTKTSVDVSESESISEQKTATATGSPGQPYITLSGYGTGETPSNTNIQFTTVGNFISFDNIATLKYTVPVTGFYDISLLINAETTDVSQLFSTEILVNGQAPNFETVTTDIETQTSTEYDGYERTLIANGFFEEGLVLTINFKYKDVPSISFTVNTIELSVINTEVTGVYLYRNHTKPITNFQGSSITAYNVPITPKRILNKHLNYLSISNYGSPNDIVFVSSEIESAIISRIDGEIADVVENDDLSSVTPIFLPVTIECDTVTDLTSTFFTNKYKYLNLFDKKNDKTYQGWVNSITFAPTKKKSTKLILQAKSI